MSYFKYIFYIITSTSILLGCSEEYSSPLRLGTNIWPGYEPLYLARELNYFQETDIRLVEYLSASEVIRSFRNGTIDAAALTLDEAILLLEKKIDVKIILVCDFSNGGDVILGNSNIQTIKGLIGKTIGVEGNALGAFMIMRALELHGLSIEDITIKQVEVDAHENAMTEGIVDAVVTFEPVKSKLIQAGAHELFTSREIPGEIVDVIVVRSSFLLSHEKQITQLSNVWFKSLKYLKDHPLDAARIMDGRLKLGPQEVLKSLTSLKFPSRQDNFRMLSDHSSDLRKTARRLKQFMISKNLMEDEVAIDNIFADNLPSLKEK